MSSPTRDAGAVNVVVVNDYAHSNGGSAQVAISSAIGLANRGYKTMFFAAVGPVSESLTNANISVLLMDQHDIKSDPNRLRAASQGIWNQKAFHRIAEAISNLDPSSTIIHVHGWTKALSSSVIRGCLKKGFPVVLTMHDYFFACPNGGFFNFPNKNACHLKPLSFECILEHCDRDGYPEKLWRCGRQAVQNILGFSDSRLISFITISDFSENVLRPFFPPDAAVYRVASPSDFIKTRPTDVTQNSRFISVGRLSQEKGLELLAQASLDLNCQVTLVGDGPSRDEIMALNPNCCITGWQNRDQVQQHLRSARALVLPSLWYEAQPMVVAEAAAMGVPAIVSDSCAGRDMVADGVTGFWFKGGDRTDLGRKMSLMMNNERAARMAQDAYGRYWRSPFSLDRHLDGLETCYRSMLKRRRQEAETCRIDVLTA